MIRRPPRSSPFPSPTLFGSALVARGKPAPRRHVPVEFLLRLTPGGGGAKQVDVDARRHLRASDAGGIRQERGGGARRSEEHTSELQSRLHLVCRLLLEKQKD